MKTLKYLLALMLLAFPLSLLTGCEAEVGDSGPNGVEVDDDGMEVDLD